MYKKQMSAQRIICLLSIVASVLVFIYALGIMTDMYDSLKPTMMNDNDYTQTMVPGSIVYYDMQPFNRVLLRVGIGLILLSCLLFITNTHSRRKYYIGNYVAVLLNVAANVIAAIWAHGQITAFRAQFLQVDFAALEMFSQAMKTLYTESTFWFDAHYAVFALTLFSSALLMVNVIWKMRLMKEERQLIEAGKAVSA
ncbi:MAG: hypothetical protein IJ124_02255 [Clostridia bacterium]|nr:hypothetical protein [Clostridia bacterium]